MAFLLVERCQMPGGYRNKKGHLKAKDEHMFITPHLLACTRKCKCKCMCMCVAAAEAESQHRRPAPRMPTLKCSIALIKHRL